MNKLSSTSNDNGSNMPMRWAASRIASAVILILLVLGGLAYGIYSLVNSSDTTPTPHSTTHTKQAPITKVTAPTPSSSIAAQTPSDTQTQLTNTGPGDVALIGFIGASLIGGLGHYAWRKRS